MTELHYAYLAPNLGPTMPSVIKTSSRDETAQPAAAAFASARERRRLMQKGIVINLLDEEIRDVRARDEPACPVARIDQHAIGVRLRPIGQDHGAHNYPVSLLLRTIHSCTSLSS
jgi:hypothetical protein